MSLYDRPTPDLHPTAICPGCNAMVVLPAEVDEDSPPAECATCGSEIPDYRREAVQAGTASYAMHPTTGTTTVVEPEEPEVPVENRRYSRAGLFRALSDTVAEKGLAALAKRTPPGLGG